MIALHITRFVGAYFLALYARGQLPYAFAVPGRARPLVLRWNLLGLADILFVVATAARLAFADP